jgi:hypothetical protein
MLVGRFGSDAPQIGNQLLYGVVVVRHAPSWRLTSRFCRAVRGA